MPTVSTSIKIHAKTKKEAQELFKDMGMSLTTAIKYILETGSKRAENTFLCWRAKI